MKSVLKNFIYVLRRFRTATLLNILGLSVAFASFIVIMMQVDYDSNFDRNIVDSQNIFRVEMVHQGTTKQGILSRPLADLLFQSSPHIQSGAITAWGAASIFFKVIGNNGVESGFLEKALKVMPSYTDVFHFEMIEGTDKAMNEPGKVLIPESIAHKIFGDESALNKQLYHANDTPLLIGGVYKDFPKNSSVQNVIYYKIPDEENATEWGNSNYCVFIRVDSPEAVAGLFDTFKKFVPKNTEEDFENRTLQFTPLPEVYFTTDVIYDNAPKSSRQTIAILFAIAFAIVIIAAVNFTNFSMALTPARIRSINIQKVLGKTVLQLRITLLLEAACTALLAFIVSLLLIRITQSTFIAELINADISLSKHMALIVQTSVGAFVIGIISGVYPAFYMTSFPPALVLKGSFGLSDKGKTMRGVLIGFQFLVSMVLIMSSMLMYMQNLFMQNSPLGYDKETLIIIDTNQTLRKEWNLFKTKVEPYPHIIGITNSSILLSSAEQYSGWGKMYKGQSILFQCLVVEYSFLKTIGIDIEEGREFTENDPQLRHGAFIFNEKAKKEYNLELNTLVDSTEIIGFIPDIKFASFRTSVDPMAFYVQKDSKWFNHVYIKTRQGENPYIAIEHIKKVLTEIDADYPFNIRFMDDVLNTTYQKEKQLSLLITTFSIIAILISIVGVFGLVVFENEYRRKEISIRKVLGSSVKEVLLLFNKTYIKIVITCFVIAVPTAYYIINSWLENFAYKTPLHWWAFLISGLVILIIVAATVSWQSWKAATANPVKSLKTE